MTADFRKKLEDYHQSGGHILILNACSNGGIKDERFAGMPQFQINDVYGGKLVAEHFLNEGSEMRRSFFPQSETSVAKDIKVFLPTFFSKKVG